MAKQKASESGNYDASAIQAMDGVEHIRARPSMYIPDTGAAGMHHIIWEIIDNCVDEHLAGQCHAIDVSLNTKTQTVTVKDDGRGIPIEPHPQTGKPTIEGIYTRTMMGGKFGKQAYAISGGLHGVGAKATCALSDSMHVTTVRGGKVYDVRFSRGKVVSPTRSTGVAGTSKGTQVTVHPDREVFGANTFDTDLFRARMEAISYLCPTLAVTLNVNGTVTKLTNKEGLSGYLKAHIGRKEETMMPSPVAFRVYGEFVDRKFKLHKTKQPDSEALDVAFWWTSGDGEMWTSWVNMIPVKEGGTHVTGGKRAITRVLSSYCKDSNVTGDDFREGLRVAIHVMLKEPHFEGQAKNRLNNPEVAGMSETAFNDFFAQWCANNQEAVKALCERASRLCEARKQYKAAKSVATQSSYADAKPGGRAALPTRLATALRCKVSERELFIVEGGSAGGNAINGREKNAEGTLFQEVLPMKGKPPNPIQGRDNPATIAPLFDNAEYRDIVLSIGAGHDLDKPGTTCDPTRARVSKIILMADADSDGGHIATLWLAFHIKYMLPLIEAGMVWVAMPPLYVAKWPRGRVFGDTREQVLERARAAGYNGAPTVTRLKGLGEMQPNELAETCLNPRTRRLMRISADKQSIAFFADLLGIEVSTRKELLGLL